MFTASAFRKLPSIYVFSYFPFGFEGRVWDLIVSVPDHCLSFYFPNTFRQNSVEFLCSFPFNMFIHCIDSVYGFVRFKRAKW